MKTIRYLLILCSIAAILPACSAFKPKYGCGNNGKNVGAEQLLSNDKPVKTKKFKA